jgi:hypothetical protein
LRGGRRGAHAILKGGEVEAEIVMRLDVDEKLIARALRLDHQTDRGRPCRLRDEHIRSRLDGRRKAPFGHTADLPSTARPRPLLSDRDPRIVVSP